MGPTGPGNGYGWGMQHNMAINIAYTVMILWRIGGFGDKGVVRWLRAEWGFAWIWDIWSGRLGGMMGRVGDSIGCERDEPRILFSIWSCRSVVLVLVTPWPGVYRCGKFADRY